MTCRTCGSARIFSITPAGRESSTIITSLGSSENSGSVTKIWRMESWWSERTRTAAPTIPRSFAFFGSTVMTVKPRDSATLLCCPHVEKDVAEHRATEDPSCRSINNPAVGPDSFCNCSCRHLDTIAADPPVLCHPEPVLQEEPYNPAL